jgi:hypothetical protein
MATGLAGIIIPRRRTAAAALLWISAVITRVLPTAEHEYTYRYVIPAVPLVCMAAALAFRDRGADARQQTPARPEPDRAGPEPGPAGPEAGPPG